jgi:hypothetical protein
MRVLRAIYENGTTSRSKITPKKVATAVDDRGRQERMREARIDCRKTWGEAEKLLRHRFVLFRLARTGGVYQPAAGCDGVGGMAEHLELRGRQPFEICFAAAPANVGVAAERAQPRARRIDHYAVERR